MPQQECIDAHEPIKRPVTDDMMCAARPNKDSCDGDSGGPLLNSRQNKLLGVVSWGQECALEDFPGVYARVSDQFDDWIKPTICTNQNYTLPAFCMDPEDSQTPSDAPSNPPSTDVPQSSIPSDTPSNEPTIHPTKSPTPIPSFSPTQRYAPSKQPSSSPTKAPTISCSHKEDMFTFNLRTDENGSELSWKLQLRDNSNGRFMNIIESGNIYGDNQVYSEAYCIQRRKCFKFIMIDSGKDGINIPGYFSIYKNENKLKWSRMKNKKKSIRKFGKCKESET